MINKSLCCDIQKCCDRVCQTLLILTPLFLKIKEYKRSQHTNISTIYLHETLGTITDYKLFQVVVVYRFSLELR